MKPQRLLRLLPPVLGLLVLSGIVIGLHGALRKISFGDILAALDATPLRQMLHALVFLLISGTIMAIYDLPGVRFAQRLPATPRLAPWRIGLASFCAYTLSHVLGAPALSSAAIRFRLYAQWRVPTAGIARIVALSGTNFSLGLTSLLGTMLLVHPPSLPSLGQHAPGLLRAAGSLLLLPACAYVLAARRRDVVRLFGHELSLPGIRLALAQIILSGADIATACAIFYAVLPSAPGLSYADVLSLYLAAFAAGAFSGLPGGVGVFDSVLLLGLSTDLPAAPALGAILLFRVLYFLIPACLGGILYAGHEFWAHAHGPKDEA